MPLEKESLMDHSSSSGDSTPKEEEQIAIKIPTEFTATLQATRLSTLYSALVMNMKWVSFITLILIASANVLVTRKSRMSSELYLPSTAVVMMELFKLVISLVGWMTEAKQLGKSPGLSLLLDDVFGPQSDYLAMSLPAAFYFIMNIFQLVAQTHLDPATFQITNQFKLLTTALFTTLWLGKTLGWRKWSCLGLILLGIVIVQSDGIRRSSTDPSHDHNGAGRVLGMLSMVLACCLSGFSGVWFEGALKGKKVSLYLRNIQLSLFSLVPGFFFAVLIVDGEQVREKGFFYGYDGYAWCSIVINSFGGILVAVVVKYADTILKVIATTLSIVLSATLSIFFFGFVVSSGFVLGALTVIAGTFLYILGDALDASWVESKFRQASATTAPFVNGKIGQTAFALVVVMLVLWHTAQTMTTRLPVATNY
ncbi:hypothetical protein HDV03_003927 [Kappamyces sp. JEL0829]|nr:hypothetical protein HDV03_003927 [Kappamyces sp. JEL0829]